MPPTSSSASPQSLSLATQQMVPDPSVFSLPDDKHRSISSSLLTCALQFFQQTREPQSSLPCEVTTPSAWNPLISNLASLPPAQTATHMPPRISLSQPLQMHSTHLLQLKKSALAYINFTMAEQAPCKNTHLNPSDMPNLFLHLSPQPPPTLSTHAYRQVLQAILAIHFIQAIFTEALNSDKYPSMVECPYYPLQARRRLRPCQLQTDCSWGATMQTISKCSAHPVHRAAALRA